MSTPITEALQRLWDGQEERHPDPIITVSEEQYKQIRHYMICPSPHQMQCAADVIHAARAILDLEVALIGDRAKQAFKELEDAIYRHQRAIKLKKDACAEKPQNSI